MTILERLGGVLAPLTTPFDHVTGDIAPIALRGNARAILEAGATGLVVAGSTGEAPLLNEEESRKSVGWVREVMKDEHILIVGAGRESTRSTVAACRAAAEEGADVALVRPPVYFASALSRQAVVDHFRAVADQSPMPTAVFDSVSGVFVVAEASAVRMGWAVIVGISRPPDRGRVPGFSLPALRPLWRVPERLLYWHHEK